MGDSPMKKRILPLLFVILACCACKPKEDGWNSAWIISDKSVIYERANTSSKALKDLSFGDELQTSEKNMGGAVTKGWLQAKAGGVRGFIENKGIADEELYKQLNDLADGAKGAPAEASGMTGKKVPLLLKPEAGAFVIQTIKEPTKVDVLGSVEVVAGDQGKRQSWYKVRLSNGRAGFIAKRFLRLAPPPELNVYTQVRTPVTWYALGKKQDAKGNDVGTDYLVSYESVGQSPDVDFMRVEIYNYDVQSGQYGTSLARSGLYGVLPINITDSDKGGKLIEIRENPKGDKKKTHVMIYSFPKPIQIVKEYTESAEEK